ncbi:MAG TPA: hypothetical protein VHL78_11125 [Actinomycetota bacterium]|nr:hypothetical protein [Actinomycetota bacterium]
MPGFVVHQGATVLCAHAGQAQPLGPVPRVRVSGQPVTVQTTPYAVAGCALTGSAPPCTTAQFVTAALRVRALGVPVLLQDSQSVCTPTGTPLQVLVTQVRVRGT